MMKMVSIDDTGDDRRRGERGAALITTLLLATLLLSVGGVLIVTAGMSNSTASDSTAELQAYYAAEAGLQAAVNVLRGNVASAAGTKATFRNAADNPSLSPWLTYNDVVNGTSVVKISTGSDPFSAYTILKVTDLDNVAAAEDPTRLLIQVRGYGPRGSIKQKEVVISRFLFDPDVPAAITVVGAEVGTSMIPGDFDIGDSSPQGYSGADSATGSATVKATFGFTQAADKGIADSYFDVDPMDPTKHNDKALASTADTPRTKLLANSDLPSWLKMADNTRTFLNEIEPIARDKDRVFTISPGKDNFGTTAEPQITFVKGDCELQGDGAGLLIVTGDLTIKGDFKFDGLILVLGTGSITRNGGGGGGIYGGLVMANFNRAATGDKFLARPLFHTNGGGSADIKYNSKNLQTAFSLLGPGVKSIREF
jgi:hypothetical protein